MLGVDFVHKKKFDHNKILLTKSNQAKQFSIAENLRKNM